jgi:hypothetical protein
LLIWSRTCWGIGVEPLARFHSGVSTIEYRSWLILLIETDGIDGGKLGAIPLISCLLLFAAAKPPPHNNNNNQKNPPTSEKQRCADPCWCRRQEGPLA